MRRRALVTLAALLALVSFSGCSTTVVDACPEIVHYTVEEQARAKVEYNALPTDAMLRRMTDDYYTMRKAARACK